MFKCSECDRTFPTRKIPKHEAGFRAPNGSWWENQGQCPGGSDDEDSGGCSAAVAVLALLPGLGELAHRMTGQ